MKQVNENCLIDVSKFNEILVQVAATPNDDKSAQRKREIIHAEGREAAGDRRSQIADRLVAMPLVTARGAFSEVPISLELPLLTTKTIEDVFCFLAGP